MNMNINTAYFCGDNRKWRIMSHSDYWLMKYCMEQLEFLLTKRCCNLQLFMPSFFHCVRPLSTTVGAFSPLPARKLGVNFCHRHFRFCFPFLFALQQVFFSILLAVQFRLVLLPAIDRRYNYSDTIINLIPPHEFSKENLFESSNWYLKLID